MPRDGLTNLVIELDVRGFQPRCIGPDSWVARCPGHRSPDHALGITRNEFNHVVLDCRGEKKCLHPRILSVLGWTNDRLYAETPTWMMHRAQQMSFRLASSNESSAMADRQVTAGQQKPSHAEPYPKDQEPQAIVALTSSAEVRSEPRHSVPADLQALEAPTIT